MCRQSGYSQRPRRGECPIGPSLRRRTFETLRHYHQHGRPHRTDHGPNLGTTTLSGRATEIASRTRLGRRITTAMTRAALAERRQGETWRRSSTTCLHEHRRPGRLIETLTSGGSVPARPTSSGVHAWRASKVHRRRPQLRAMGLTDTQTIARIIGIHEPDRCGRCIRARVDRQ